MRHAIVEFSESFHGELPFIGQPCIIIRFPGCNLKCSYCDTLHEATMNLGTETLVDMIQATGLYNILFTGGEPLLSIKSINTLIKSLGEGYHYVIETNGTIPLFDILEYEQPTTVVMDWKLGVTANQRDTAYANLIELLPSDHLKFVFSSIVELLQCIDDFKKVIYLRTNCINFIFSPVFQDVSKLDMKRVSQLIIDLQREYPSDNIRLQLQLHKILGIA